MECLRGKEKLEKKCHQKFFVALNYAGLHYKVCSLIKVYHEKKIQGLWNQLSQERHWKI